MTFEATLSVGANTQSTVSMWFYREPAASFAVARSNKKAFSSAS
jgi:hypothetical protein